MVEELDIGSLRRLERWVDKGKCAGGSHGEKVCKAESSADRRMVMAIDTYDELDSTFDEVARTDILLRVFRVIK